jgi:WD40 repeat protein
MEWKDVPIFISSTFNDMHAERDYLVKNVFPELAEWCERRKLRLIDIDLRWGVTKEDSETNRTVRKCLESIDNCRPFFLCFLGQRRGWVPDAIQVGDAVLAYRDDRGFFGDKSVTEIEIEHALLSPLYIIAQNRAPNPDKHALFFFRNKPGGDEWDSLHRRLFENDALEDEGKSVTEADQKLADFKAEVKDRRGAIDYDCRFDIHAKTPELCPPELLEQGTNELSQENTQKIELSKGRLRDFVVPINNIPDKVYEVLENEFPEQAGRPKVALKYVVIAGLIGEILDEYPERTTLPEGIADPYKQDIEQQEVFIHHATEGFIPVPNTLERLDAYISSAGVGHSPLLITADAGFGKTTLLAHWVEKKRTLNKNIIFRFCGTSDLSSDPYSLWDSIFQQCGIAVPLSLEDLKKKFNRLLQKLTPGTIIVVDAVDQLRDSGTMLSWLPRELPAHLSLILSQKTGKTETEGYETVRLSPLSDGSKTAIIASYLKKSLKTLDEHHIKEICGIKPQNPRHQKASSNPLYLKILLSELRVFGAYEQLGDQIGKYGYTPFDAFTQMLKRLEREQTYDTLPPKQAVPLLFGLLCRARNGLSESELAFCFTKQLGEDERILGTIRFLLRQVRLFTARREGRTDFLYDEFRRAAQERYSDLRQACHLLLSRCYSEACDPGGNDTFDSGNVRALVELGYHTTEYDFSEGERLYSTLTYIDSRCEASTIRSLLAELDRFEGEVCRSFRKILLRFYVVLSGYPNTLFSICHAAKKSAVYLETDTLLSDRLWTKPWLGIEPVFTLTTERKEKPYSASVLRLIAESESVVFNETCAFSPDGALLVYSETLELLRVYNTTAFEPLPCVIYVRPVRAVSMRFSPNGRYLAVAHEDGAIELFKLVYSEDNSLSQAINIKRDIKAFKPKRGYSSYDFAGECLVYQTDACEIKICDLSENSEAVIMHTEQPVVLDAVLPVGDTVMFSLRRAAESVLYRYSHAGKGFTSIQVLDRVFIRFMKLADDTHFYTVLSDNRLIVFDVAGEIAAEIRPEPEVRFICTIGDKLLLLCHGDELLLWDRAAGSTSSVQIPKEENRHLYGLALAGDGQILSVFGSTAARFELCCDGSTDSNAVQEIIAMDEVPLITVAVRDKQGISVCGKDFHSETVRPQERLSYFVCMGADKTYLLDERGQGYSLETRQTSFQPAKGFEGALRVLRYSTPLEGRVYYIDTLWHLRCEKSNYSHDLSSYHFGHADMRTCGKYLFIFGNIAGVQAIGGAATGHETFSKILLIFESVNPGRLHFYGERVFPTGYGTPTDVALHEKFGRIYVLFNTPNSAKAMDFLTVCYGTKEEFMLKQEQRAELNIPRRQGKTLSTACAANSYLVCYEGNIYAYDAVTLTYQAAAGIDSSFSIIEPSQRTDSYALALCNHGTQVVRVIPYTTQ